MVFGGGVILKLYAFPCLEIGVSRPVADQRVWV